GERQRFVVGSTKTGPKIRRAPDLSRRRRKVSERYQTPVARRRPGRRGRRRPFGRGGATGSRAGARGRASVVVRPHASRRANGIGSLDHLRGGKGPDWQLLGGGDRAGGSGAAGFRSPTRRPRTDHSLLSVGANRRGGSTGCAAHAEVVEDRRGAGGTLNRSRFRSAACPKPQR